MASWKKAGNVEITPWKKSVRKLWGSREKDRDLARRLARGGPAHPDSADSEGHGKLLCFWHLHAITDKETKRETKKIAVHRLWTEC